MALNKKEILKIADLAKLKLSDKEAASYGRQLEEVLIYVNKINQLNLKDIELSLSGAQESVLGLREDKSLPSDQTISKKVPKKKAGFVVVPNVFNKKNG